MISDFWSAMSSIATAITASITLAAVIIALKAAKISAKQTTLLREQIDSQHASRLIDIHSRFQSEIREIQRKFPANVNNPTWIPNDAEILSIMMYWYLVFDEWLTCVHMGSDLKNLWEKHYAQGVISALKLPAFREKIEDIFRGDSSFLGYGADFKEEIERLCLISTGEPLKL